MPTPKKKPTLTPRSPSSHVSPLPTSSVNTARDSKKPQILAPKKAPAPVLENVILRHTSDLASNLSQKQLSLTSLSSRTFISRLKDRYSILPTSLRRALRVFRVLVPIIPIGIFFSEHVLQVMWVRGPSMTPYLNENYAETQTESDMVLVNMWTWGSWPWQQRRRLERGMVVTFR